VKVKVLVPKDLTPEQREAVKKIAGAYRGDPRAEYYRERGGGAGR